MCPSTSQASSFRRRYRVDSNASPQLRNRSRTSARATCWAPPKAIPGTRYRYFVRYIYSCIYIHIYVCQHYPELAVRKITPSPFVHTDRNNNRGFPPDGNGARMQRQRVRGENRVLDREDDLLRVQELLKAFNGPFSAFAR